VPKFAVYYVPQAENDFYRLGTSILGYDVRARKPIPMPDGLQKRLGDFDQDWTQSAQPYGFHLTIGDAIDFAFGDIQSIEHEIDGILKCFAPDRSFALQRREDDFVTFWGKRKEIVVLRYDPNDYLIMLHTLITARVNPLGSGSGYLQKHLKDPGQYVNQPHQAHKTKKFYSPMVLGSYAPHFTLLNPYTGQEHDRLAHAFSEMFKSFSRITLDSICLLVQMNKEEKWEIYREFKLLNK
jgi:hypothetical protein